MASGGSAGWFKDGHMTQTGQDMSAQLQNLTWCGLFSLLSLQREQEGHWAAGRQLASPGGVRPTAKGRVEGQRKREPHQDLTSTWDPGIPEASQPRPFQ